MDEDILTTDVDPNLFNDADTGADALDVYIVAPARMTHHVEGSNINWPSYCDIESANADAKARVVRCGFDMVRYKLVPAERFNVKKEY